MPAVNFFNIIIFAFTSLTTASAFWIRPWFRYAIAFTSMLLTGYLADSIQNYLQPIYALIMILCFAQKEQMIHTATVSMTAISFLWGITMIAGSIVVLIAPDFIDTTAYNILIGAVLAVASIGLKVFISLRRVSLLPEHWRSRSFLIALEIILMAFFTFVLPQFALRNLRHYAITQLSLMCLLAVVCVLLCAYTRSQERNRRLAFDRRQIEEIKQESESMISLKHFYMKLYESMLTYIRRKDMSGLTKYFEEYITPTHSKYVKLKNIEGIENALLKNLLELAANYAASHPVQFDYEITGYVEIPKSLEMDVFHVLAEWLNNAFDALDSQKYGKLHVSFTGIATQCHFIVRNTVPYAPQVPKTGRGKGLPDVYHIIDRNPHFERFTEQRDEMYIQHLIVKL